MYRMPYFNKIVLTRISLIQFYLNCYYNLNKNVYENRIYVNSKWWIADQNEYPRQNDNWKKIVVFLN